MVPPKGKLQAARSHTPRAPPSSSAKAAYSKAIKRKTQDPNEKAVEKLLKQTAPSEPAAKRQRKGEGQQRTQEAVRLWEEVRQHETTEEKRRELVNDILSLIKGHIANVAASPTASRIIQSCVKHGTAAHRSAILAEIQPRLVELAQNPYGHFLVSKLLAKTPNSELPGLLKSFKGHVPQLLRHPKGSSVIDDAYLAANAQQRNAMAAEFYGREFNLFEGSVPVSLKEVLDGADKVKQRQVLQNMSQHLVPIMEKGIVDPLLSHRLIAEYLERAPTSAVEDAVQTLSGVNLLRMAHTREGAAATCMVLAYGTAKDRKQAVKAMQGHVKTMACDQWAHLVLITALSRVDDTALLRKHIISDLQASLAELLDNVHGRRVLLHLLDPAAARRALPADAAALIDPPQRLRPPAAQTAAAADTSAAATADEQRSPTDAPATAAQESVPLGQSKKEPEVRQKELLGSGSKSLAAQLLAATSQAAQQLLHCKNSGEFCIAAVGGGSDAVLREAAPDGVAALHNSIVQLAAQPLRDDADGHILVQFYSSRTLRRLIRSSGLADSNRTCAVDFVAKLWTSVFSNRCKEYLDGHAEKVLAAMLECGSDSVRQSASQQLQKLLDQPVDEWLAGHRKASEVDAAPAKKKASKKKAA